MSVTRSVTISADDSLLVKKLHDSGVCPANCREVTIKTSVDSLTTITYECFLTSDVLDALPIEIADEVRQQGGLHV